MATPLDMEHSLNVQAVELRTGITAETLRTWERRYGWPRPQRLPNDYRLYSEDDVALIQAVRQELRSGVSASTAWQRVVQARERRPASGTMRGTEHLRDRLVDALVAFQPIAARELLAEAHAIYPVERVLLEVIQPCLIEIGERWHRGEVTITQEHFASNLLRDRLVALCSFYSPRIDAATIMVGAGPGDLHDIGALMLAVVLRSDGHNVIYLGQNLGLEHLSTALQQARPRLLLLSASRLETARGLAEVAPLLAAMPPPRPLFAFGGRAFAGNPDAAVRIGGTYIGGDVGEARARIEELLSGGPRAQVPLTIV